MVEWKNRYSNTDEFDNQGRWARIAYVNGLQIGWISGVIVKDAKIYTAKTVFPVSGNDLAIGVFSRPFSNDCIDWVEEKWIEFIDKIRTEDEH